MQKTAVLMRLVTLPRGSLAAVLFWRVPTQSQMTHASGRKHAPFTIISKGRVFKKLRQKFPKSSLTVYYLPVTHSLLTHCNDALPFSFCTPFDLRLFDLSSKSHCWPRDIFFAIKTKRIKALDFFVINTQVKVFIFFVIKIKVVKFFDFFL